MTVALFIPARYASSRYPGKPLAPLRGATGEAKSLVRRSWEAATAVAGVDHVAVATDDERIAAHARAFGAEVATTSSAARNGTERCAEAAKGGSAEIVVNLQGDAPLTPPWFVEELVAALRAAPESVAMATPVLRCDADALAGFQADRAAGRVGGTTAVMRPDRRALYFSKEVLPFTPTGWRDPPEVWHHVGVYAYRPEALAAYAAWPEGALEAREGLEQLRFLENGAEVLCVEVEAKGAVFWELNNPEDAPRIEAALAARGAT
ncbi:MAG: manno-octulosonate cytidylyltransferase [Pseudomonadota bacterium]